MNMPIDDCPNPTLDKNLDSKNDSLNQELARLVAAACQAPPDTVLKLIEKKRTKLAALIFSGNSSLDGYTMINHILPPQGRSLATISKQYGISRGDRQNLENFRRQCLGILFKLPEFSRYYRVQRGRLIQKILAKIEANVSIPAKYEEAFSLTRIWFIEHLCEYDPERNVPVLSWFNSEYAYRIHDANTNLTQSRQTSFDDDTLEQSTPQENRIYSQQPDLFERNELIDTFEVWLQSYQDELQQIFVPGYRDSLNAYIVLKAIIPIVESGDYKNISDIWKHLSDQYPISANRFRNFFYQDCQSYLFEYACERGWISWVYYAEVWEIIQRDEKILKKKIIKGSKGRQLNAYELISQVLTGDLNLRSLAEIHNLDIIELMRFWNQHCFPYLQWLGENLLADHADTIRVTLGCLNRIETEQWVRRNKELLRNRTSDAYPHLNAYRLITEHLYPTYTPWEKLARTYNIPAATLKETYRAECLPFLARIAQFLYAKTTRNWIRDHQDDLQKMFWDDCPYSETQVESIHSYELLNKRIIQIHKNKDWPQIFSELRLDYEKYRSNRGENKSRKILDQEKLTELKNGLRDFYHQRCLPDFFDRTENLRS